MAQKCECCGYKFKKGDGAICPECFTSREATISCDDLPFDLHAHNENTSFSDSGMSDVQKQLEMERLEAQKEKIERNTQSFSSGNTATGNRSTTFGPSFTGANKGTTFSNAKSSTTYNTNKNGTTTTYTTTYSSSGASPRTVYRTSYNSNNMSNGASKAVKIIIIFIAVSIILSVASTVIFAVVGMNAAKKNDYDDYKTTTFSYVQPEISIPDIDLPEIELPKIPVIVEPTVPGIPDFPQYNTGTNYYQDIAIIAQGEKIIADDYEVVVGTPVYVPYQPSSYATDYDEYVDWDDISELYVVEVPLTVTNNSGERINISEFDAYLDCLFIDENGDISDECFADPLPTDDYKKDIIEDSVTYSFSLYYAVPVSHYFSVALQMSYEGNPEYVFYTDFAADMVFKD
ncbi:MAG: hypothetical protein IJ401_00450 [Oscillospiraceae bacterium]|nr:hypothetical protein [Oscillospiraceae bacterium]